MTCGVYLLRFEGTDKVYIGQSINIELRFKSHIRLLKTNKSSKKLIDAYNTFGTPSLEIILECSENELNISETEAIEIFNSVSNGFNSLENPEDTPLNKGTLHGRAKYSEEQIVKVFNLLTSNPELLHKEISIMTGVSTNTISGVSKRTVHTWLKDVYPEQYKLLENRKPYHCSGHDRGKTYPLVVSPQNVVYEVKNVTEFSKEHNLGQSNLSAVLNGKRNSHKGWKLKGDIS